MVVGSNPTVPISLIFDTECVNSHKLSKSDRIKMTKLKSAHSYLERQRTVKTIKKESVGIFYALHSSEQSLISEDFV
ncbi:MAG: hypothetical protein AB8X94_02785 [Coxiella endosymbiont of Dermacentor silvarum]